MQGLINTQHRRDQAEHFKSNYADKFSLGEGFFRRKMANEIMIKQTETLDSMIPMQRLHELEMSAKQMS